MARSTPKSSPDPLFILRGHRKEVQALAFHPGLEILYSGDCQGILKAWKWQQRRSICSCRLHSAQAGILQLHVLQHRPAMAYKLLSQGRDGLLKLWLLGPDGALAEAPQQVISAGSFNFCRASVLQTRAPTRPAHAPGTSTALPQHDRASISSAVPPGKQSASYPKAEQIAEVDQEQTVLETPIAMATASTGPGKQSATICQAEGPSGADQEQDAWGESAGHPRPPADHPEARGPSAAADGAPGRAPALQAISSNAAVSETQLTPAVSPSSDVNDASTLPGQTAITPGITDHTSAAAQAPPITDASMSHKPDQGGSAAVTARAGSSPGEQPRMRSSPAVQGPTGSRNPLDGFSAAEQSRSMTDALEQPCEQGHSLDEAAAATGNSWRPQHWGDKGSDAASLPDCQGAQDSQQPSTLASSRAALDAGDIRGAVASQQDACHVDAEQQPQPSETIADTRGPPANQPEVAGPALMALAGRGPAIAEVWDIEEGKLLVQLVTSQKWGMCMAACLLHPPVTSPHVHLLAGYEDGTVAVWNTGLPAVLSASTSNGKQPPVELVMHLKAHGEPLMALTADPSGTGAVSASAEDYLLLLTLGWEHRVISVQARLRMRQAGAGDIVIRPDRRICIAGGWDGKIRIFTYPKGRPLAVLQHHSKAITAIAFQPNTVDIVAAACRDGSISVWSLFPET
ncbi:hypothetical protein WJX74_008738 [Apatococcus lobatus]|uniref:Uncharacterized protein n=1 Tax=Apatococcus lobatus TaxID=904363 RepID=A0AAW1QIS8_9CHLO